MRYLLAVLTLTLAACGGLEPESCRNPDRRCSGQEIQICPSDSPTWVTQFVCPEGRTCALNCGNMIEGNGPCCR
jgi:hypothetical protein